MDTTELLIKFTYLISSVLFIFGIKFLTRVKTARRGNIFAAVGMLLATIATLVNMGIDGKIGWEFIAGGLAVGGLIGVILSKKVEMTSMPELVAVFNGVGGLASVLVASSYLFSQKGEELDAINLVTVVLSVVIGTVTFTGSLVAFGKLKGIVSGKPIMFFGSQILNIILALGVVALAVFAIMAADGSVNSDSINLALAMIAVSALLGILLVTPIGGADMPVVISLLNSYSGVAAAATGFVLGNTVLVISGALVGASGLILTQIMCKAMNRSLANVLFGGFGQDDETSGGGGSDEYTTVKSTSAEEVAMMMDGVGSVIIVPGYGMAVGQAQHAVADMTNELEKKGVDVKFAVHPVAGRMPGHMNVLLAEANIPYDKLKDLDEINSSFKNTDVVYVIGANDVVNPAAVEDPQSEIYGMPILNAHEARTVVVVKRSLSPGFANIKNGLFERENALMLFDDAKKATEEIVKELKEL